MPKNAQMAETTVQAMQQAKSCSSKYCQKTLRYLKGGGQGIGMAHADVNGREAERERERDTHTMRARTICLRKAAFADA